jgi:hypothetical protein
MRDRGRGRGRTSAFTLVEILLALAIFTGVVAAIYACWSSLLRSAQVSQAAAAEAQRKRMAICCLEDVLLSAQLFNQNARHYAFLADTASDDPSLSLVAHLSKSFPRSGRFEGQPVRRVTFTLEKDPTGGKILLMRQTPVLFEPDADEEENPLVLARNVRAFEVDFWGPNSRDWEPEWLSTNQLPRLVRFSIGFGSPGVKLHEEDLVSRVIALPSTGVPALPAIGPRGNVPPGQQGPGVGPGPGPRGGGPGQPPPQFNPRGGRRP